MNRGKLITAASKAKGVVYQRSDLRTDDALAMLSLEAWMDHGLQSVQMPARFQAALMATDAREALDDGEPLPWPAFEIQVDRNLLRASSPVFSVLVARAPAHILIRDPIRGGLYPPGQIIVLYVEEAGPTTANFAPTLKALFDPELQANEAQRGLAYQRMNDLERAAVLKVAHERRLWTMIARLVAGVVLTINEERDRNPLAFGGGRPAARREHTAKPMTWKLGKPLELDVRRAVSDYVNGTRSELRTQHLRRGHWRRQPFGVGRLQRRRQWIEPAWVGSGPRLLRPVRLGLGYSVDQLGHV